MFMFLQVKIPSCVLYHYDVAIVPDKCPRRVNREIIEALINAHADYFGHQKPVFDGRKNLYSRRPLPIGRDRVSTHTHSYALYHFTHFQSSQSTGDLWLWHCFQWGSPTSPCSTTKFVFAELLFFSLCCVLVWASLSIQSPACLWRPVITPTPPPCEHMYVCLLYSCVFQSFAVDPKALCDIPWACQRSLSPGMFIYSQPDNYIEFEHC